MAELYTGVMQCPLVIDFQDFYSYWATMVTSFEHLAYRRQMGRRLSHLHQENTTVQTYCIKEAKMGKISWYAGEKIQQVCLSAGRV